jgi:hypothetical protein
MNWLTKFIFNNWNYLLGGLVLLMVFICGVQIGESRINREWNAEKLRAALVVAKQEQRVADIRQSQTQINQEISNDFEEKKKLLVGLRSAIRTGTVGVRLEPSHSLDALPVIPSVTDRAAAVASDAVSDPAGTASATGCEQLAIDAAQTTLMVLEFQRWHAKQTQQMSLETGSDP